MKKLALTIAIVLGMTVGVMAQQGGGGLFERGYVSEEMNDESGNGYFSQLRGLLELNLPSHGQDDNQSAPLGSGIAALAGLGAAYLAAKRRKEQ